MTKIYEGFFFTLGNHLLILNATRENKLFTPIVMSTTSEDETIIIEGRVHPDISKNSLTTICTTSYALGITLGLFIGLIPYLSFKPFNLYIIALSIFHFLEFYITAKYNPGKVHDQSFLINNGKGYLIAHAVCVSECFIEALIFPHFKTFHGLLHKILIVAGLCLLIGGQTVRTLAMCTASKSFSHTVKTEKLNDHVLVTNGIYAFSRHPSYFGFYYWALGTQLLLLNPISFIGFAIVLFRFFRARIKFEEEYLVSFFGKDYVKYRARVSTRIPFIQ